MCFAVAMSILFVESNWIAAQTDDSNISIGQLTLQIERSDQSGDFEKSFMLRQQRLNQATGNQIRQEYFRAELRLFEEVLAGEASSQQQLVNMLSAIGRFRRDGGHLDKSQFAEIDLLKTSAEKILPSTGHPIRVGLETMRAAKLMAEDRGSEAYEVLQRARRDCAAEFGCPSLAETLPRLLLVKLNRSGEHAVIATELESITRNIEGLIGVDHPWFVQLFTLQQMTFTGPFSNEMINRIDALKSRWSQKAEGHNREYLALLTAQTRAMADSDAVQADDLGNLASDLILQHESASSMAYADIQLARAECLLSLKRVDSARESLEQALGIYEKAGAFERIKTALAKRLLGRLELISKNDQVGLAHYQSAYEIFTKNAPAHQKLLAKYTVPIADEFVELGYLDQAIYVYRRALTFELFDNNSDDRDISSLMDRLAIAFGSKYGPVAAHEAWRSSLENGFATINHAMAAGDLQVAIEKSERLAVIVRDFVSLTDPANPAQTIMAFEYATRVKGLAMRMMAASDEIRANANRKAIQTALNQFNAGLEDLAQTAFRSRTNILRENEIVVLQTRQQELLNQIVSTFEKRTRAVLGMGAVSDAIMNNLPEDFSIVEIVPATTIGNNNLSDYVAFVVSRPIGTSQFNIAMVRLDETETIDKIAREWREQIASTERVERHIIEPLGLDVREAIWKPLAVHLGNTRNIIVCAPGELGRMPWAAIPNIKNKPPLSSTPIWLISVLGAVAFVMLALARIRTQSSKRYIAAGVAIMAIVWGGWKWVTAPKAQDKFVIAEHTFTVCSDSPNLMERGGELNQRDDQVTLISINANNRTTNRTQEIGLAKSHAGTKTLVDSDTDKRAVMELLESTKGGVHLIANGGDPPDRDETTWPVKSEIALTGEQSISGHDVVRCSMDSVDWILLSTVNSAEGNPGLQQVFYLGGAKSVIGNLWAPTDERCYRFVDLLYRNLKQEELSLAEALRQTQLQMIGKGYPTCDWAAWNLYGDFR